MSHIDNSPLSPLSQQRQARGRKRSSPLKVHLSSACRSTPALRTHASSASTSRLVTRLLQGRVSRDESRADGAATPLNLSSLTPSRASHTPARTAWLGGDSSWAWQPREEAGEGSASMRPRPCLASHSANGVSVLRQFLCFCCRGHECYASADYY